MIDICLAPMILKEFQLDGKIALVTGSHKGLGAAIAVALAHVGANVACHGRNPFLRFDSTAANSYSSMKSCK
jgi:NAD(P)-dependent dehydrogenase (short-subunit alcohol dehydrogenase family)